MVKNSITIFFIAFVLSILASSVFRVHNLETQVNTLNNKHAELSLSNKQLSVEQTKHKIDILHIKNEMESYSILVNHQQQRLARISKVKDIIKKHISTNNNISRTDIYKIAYSVVDYSSIYDVPANLLLGLIRQESAFDPNAVSPTGAIGLTQILPSTGETISKELNMPEYDLKDIEINVKFGAYYLSKMLDHYQNKQDLALQGYTAGELNVDKFINGEIDKVPYDANDYSVRIINYAEKYSELGVR